MRRFALDDVVPAPELLPTRRLDAGYRHALAFGGDPATPVIDHGPTHPLLAAVGLAFAEHRPLTLSPDAVWLTLAQGVAQHVRRHADTLRSRLVRHQGRERLGITTTSVPTDAAEWASALADLRTRLAAEIGDGRARLFECDFSTSTDVDRLASQIVLLDAYSPYFSYWMFAICGIPEVTLLGTVDDWRKIRERIDVIAELDLAFWCRSLVPIADQFVRAAGGDIDAPFWRRIYNPEDAYGGEVITGWITRLYPYVKHGGTVSTKNPMLDLPIDEPKHHTTATERSYTGRGLHSGEIPATVSRVTVHIVDHLARDLRSVDLVAGVTAVAQDPDGALRPITGWHIEPATPRMADVIALILAHHHVVPPDPTRHRGPVSGPAELLELHGQIDSATLFTDDRAWHLRSPPDQQWVHVEGCDRFSIRRIADLPTGTSLCAATSQDTLDTQWLLCRIDAPESDPSDAPTVRPRRATALDLPSEIRVLGTSLAAILDAALTTGGDVTHLEVARFEQVLHG